MNSNFNQTLDALDELYESALELNTPYMLRRDGKLISCKSLTIHPYINTLPTSTKNKMAAYKFLLDNGELENYQWFLDNTLNSSIKSILKALIDKTVNIADIDIILNKLSYETNQEFCRVRTSGKFLGSSSNQEIYFRISSYGFNWFNLIWQIVYENKFFISKITVCTDEKAKGRDEPYCYRGIELNQLSIDEFLALPGRPIIEQIFDENVATTSLTESLNIN